MSICLGNTQHVCTATVLTRLSCETVAPSLVSLECLELVSPLRPRPPSQSHLGTFCQINTNIRHFKPGNFTRPNTKHYPLKQPLLPDYVT